MVVPRGLVMGVQIVGFVLGMAGVPCFEYGVVGKLQAALLRHVVAVTVYGLMLVALLALLSDIQSLGLQPPASELSGEAAVFLWLCAIAVLLSYVLAYTTPRLDPHATLRHLGIGSAAGSGLIGICALIFTLFSGAGFGAALGAGVLVAVCFLSAGFAFLIVPLVAPRAGGRSVTEFGAFALLIGLLLASLPRILFLFSIAMS
ncbi:MAG TPA: hypothetical protein VF120_14385 [Ktedonobacterales bacterium]